jgi:predicted RNase H-like nuclease (RuvC/YqgF family)
MSSSTQLEQIQQKRAELENELRSLEEKEKNLGASIKITEEKRVIQELEEKVKAKRAVVEKLESKKRELEKKLGEPQKKEPMEVTVKVAPNRDHQSEKPEEQPEGQQEKEKILPAILEKMK